MEWEIFDKFYHAHWFLTGYSCQNFPKLLKVSGNKPVRSIAIMEDDVNSMLFDKNQFDKNGHFLASRLINDYVWRKGMNDKHDYYCRQFFKASERLKKILLSQMTDRQLVVEFKKILPLQKQVRILGTTLNGLPLDGRNHLSNKLRAELRQLINDDANFDKYWSFLTQPTKLSMRQKKDIEIASVAKLARTKSSEEIERKLKNIYDKYCWLDYMYYGPPASFKQFQIDYKKAIKNNINLKLEIHLKLLARKQQALINKLKFGRRARYLIQLAQDVLWQKGWRKDVEYHAFYCYEPIFREIAERKKIEDWQDTLYLLPWELENFVFTGKPRPEELKQRRKFSCLISDIGKDEILAGQKAKKFYNTLNLEKKITGIAEARGQVAFAGKAKGIVKIINVPEDMGKMKKGDILVSQATSPDLLLAMKKAAAIVTNTGGLIAHAAITARELKIPCIVGTTNATEVFKDGDMVEVDATKGIARMIRQ